jgi:hypothetical protein
MRQFVSEISIDPGSGDGAKQNNSYYNKSAADLGK